MSNAPYVRAALAQVALDFVPPLIRLSLVDNTEFKEEYGLSAEVDLALGDSGVPIQRSRFFDAVRQALGSPSAIEVTDNRDEVWQLANQAEAGDLPKLVLSSGEHKLFLGNLAVLSPEPEVRLRSLDTLAVNVNLPTSAQDTWREILKQRALEDHEVDQFRSDLHATPVHVAGMIRSQMKQGNASVSSLVPYSRTYFERLVGVYDGSTSILNYAGGAGKDVLEQLSSWRPDEGFMLGLFLSSHAALTAVIGVDRLKKEDIVQCYEYLVTHGDVISRLGAIEIGLRILPENHELEPFVVQLIEQIRDDDIDGTTSSFKLFSGLFILVDGELSRTRLMCSTPPFYRRLASLSHAALIHRQLLPFTIDYEQFYDWAFNSGVEQYFMQSLSDMRVEPRWNPELAEPRQLKAECFGRILLAASHSEIELRGTNLHNLIFGPDPGSLSTLSKFPGPYLPGPLEGSEVIRNHLPADLAEVIEAQITREPVDPSSFIALVNSAMIFGTDSAHVELAASALRLGDHRLRNVGSESELLVVLMGLAKVAAAARSTELADELRILMRRYEHDRSYSLLINDKLPICLLAAASRSDLTEWRNFVGEWFTELAFGELRIDEAKAFHSYLRCLCHAVPELWVSCGRADAALIAFADC